MAQHLSNLPLGALIKFGRHVVGSESAQPIIWRVADKNHSGYPSNSVTLITDKVVDIRLYDRGEGSGNVPNVNYGVSNIDQWLNSAGSANNWYQAAHSSDASPPYANRPGFLYNFTEEERLSLLPTTFNVQVISNVSNSITRKVFLPSLWELTGSHSYADGSSRFAGFTSPNIEAYLTAQAFANSTSIYKPSSVSTAMSYLTRSTIQSSGTGANYVISITKDSGRNWEDARTDCGVRPCANLSANTKISDTVDSDGCYTFLSQSAPNISGTNSNLGTRTEGFSQTYTIGDVDNDIVTVSEYIDNVKVRSYVATLGATNALAVTGDTWFKLTNGNHTLKITATDGFDEVTRTYTFVKSVTKLVVQRATPLTASAMPKSIIVTVVKVVPDGAIFKVEACNNGFDAVPTWEDITTRVLQGRIYDFTNTTKTAGQWGVNIRVTVDRNGSEGACYITEIGGNFE